MSAIRAVFSLPVAAVSVLVLATAACAFGPTPTPPKPTLTQEQAIEAVHQSLLRYSGLADNWASPQFPLSRWCAAWRTYRPPKLEAFGQWEVQVYDVDGTEKGMWVFSESDRVVEPYDITSKQLLLSYDLSKVTPEPPFAKHFDGKAAPPDRPTYIAQMPPLPPFAQTAGDPGDALEQAVETHIAGLGATETAGKESVTGLQRLILDDMVVDWLVTYDSTGWIVEASHGEYRVIAYLDPTTGAVKELADASGITPETPGSACEVNVP